MGTVRPLEIDKIYLLHLIRGILPLSDERSASDNQSQKSRFTMFDYFDRLEIAKEDQINSRACLGLGIETDASRQPMVSSQYLTLITLKGEREPDEPEGATDPFYESDPSCLTDKPFLGLIMVSILPIPLSKEKLPDSALFTPQIAVDSFLRTCSRELKRCVGETIHRYFNNLGIADNLDKRVIYQVYHCVNSGDFCIAIRSGAPKLIYEAAMTVRETFLNRRKTDNSFPAVECSTFTLMGLEYIDPEGSAEPLDISQFGDSPSNISMRVSGTATLYNSLSPYRNPNVVAGTYGKYGRYDLTFSVTLEQFAKLYPWICANKFGFLPPENESTELKNGKSDVFLRKIKRAIYQKDVKFVTIDFQTGLDNKLKKSNKKKAYNRQRQEKVQAENGYVISRIKLMLNRISEVPYFQEETRTCLYQLWDLWESYSSLRFQDDSFINGRLLFTQICTLLLAVEIYLTAMDTVPAEEMKKSVRSLVQSLKISVNSISHFQKLILSMNRQSLQSPNYEVQLHADMEKYVVAYTEFSRRFLAEHFRKERPDDPADARQLLFPIIIMDVEVPVIQAEPLFLLPYKYEGDGYVTSNEHLERVFLAIEMPDLGSFGTLYETLPYICHELSHNFRFLDRKVRNDALTRMVMHKIASYIFHIWISKNDGNSVYMALGELENEFCGILADMLQEMYLKSCGTKQVTANIGALISNILLFLTQNVFMEEDAYIRSQPALTINQFGKLLDSMYSIAVKYCPGTPSWQNDFDSFRASVVQGDFSRIDNVADLADKMGNTICRGMLTRILETLQEHAVELKSIVVNAQKKIRSDTDSALWERLEDAYNSLYDTYSSEVIAATERFGDEYILRWSPGKLDALINEFWQAGTGVRDSVYRFCDDKNICHLCDLPSIGKLRRYGSDYYYLTNEICSTLKDTHHLFMLLCGTKSKNLEKSSKRMDSIDTLVESYWRALNAKIDRIYVDTDASDDECLYQRAVYSAPQIRSLMAPLGLDTEQNGLFRDSLMGVLGCIPKKMLETQVKEVVELYREIFADLGMCVALGLDPFGYLRVLSQSSAMCENSRQGSIGANAKMERIWVVCQALTGEDDICFDKLEERFHTLFASVRGEIEAKMVPDRPKEKWDLFKKDVEIMLEDHGPGFENAEPVTLPFSFSELTTWIIRAQEEKTAASDKEIIWLLYRKLQNVWRLVQLLRNLKYGSYLSSHSMREHFTGLYADMRQKWAEQEKITPLADMVECVGNAYNDQGRSIFEANDHALFKTSLAFVLYFYYHSWNMYSHFSLQSEEEIEDLINQQIDRLMGGISE